MTDTRPNGRVTWQTTIVEERTRVFSPDEMESLGFVFTDERWERDYSSDRDPADELADAESAFGELVVCEREIDAPVSTHEPVEE
jgi:hypothetical protein